MGVVGVVGQSCILSTYCRLASICSLPRSASDAADCADLQPERSKVNAVLMTGGTTTWGVLSTYCRLASNSSLPRSASAAAACADLQPERSKVNAVLVTCGASTGGDGARRGSGGSGGSGAIVYTEYVLQAGLQLQLGALSFCRGRLRRPAAGTQHSQRSGRDLRR